MTCWKPASRCARLAAGPGTVRGLQAYACAARHHQQVHPDTMHTRRTPCTPADQSAPRFVRPCVLANGAFILILSVDRHRVLTPG